MRVEIARIRINTFLSHLKFWQINSEAKIIEEIFFISTLKPDPDPNIRRKKECGPDPQPWRGRVRIRSPREGFPGPGKTIVHEVQQKFNSFWLKFCNWFNYSTTNKVDRQHGPAK